MINKRSTLVSVLIVGLMGLMVVGCSSDNPVLSQQDNFLASGNGQKYEFIYTGRVANLDRANRSFAFEDKQDLNVYIDESAKIFALPNLVEIPFDASASAYESSANTAGFSEGSTVTVYGSLKSYSDLYGDKRSDILVIAQRIEVESSETDDTFISNDFESGNPDYDRSYEIVLNDRLVGVDFANRTISLGDRENLQVYVDYGAPIVSMPQRVGYDFESLGSADHRTSPDRNILVANADLVLYGEFKSDEVFIAQKVLVWEPVAGEDFISNSVIVYNPNELSRNFDLRLEGRVAAIDYENRTFEISGKDGLLFSLENNAPMIRIPDGTPMEFTISHRSSAPTVEIGSNVIVYGDEKSDELVTVGFMQIWNNDLIVETTNSGNETN